MFNAEDYSNIVDCLVEVGKEFKGKLTFVNEAAQYIRTKNEDNMRWSIPIVVSSDKVRKDYIQELQKVKKKPFNSLKYNFYSPDDYTSDFVTIEMVRTSDMFYDTSLHLVISIANEYDDLSSLLQSPEDYIFVAIAYIIKYHAESDEIGLIATCQELDEATGYLAVKDIDFSEVNAKLAKNGFTAKELNEAMKYIAADKTLVPFDGLADLVKRISI